MTLTTFLAAALATVALAAAGSFLLPRHVTVERTALLDVAPETVLSLASSSAGYQQFNPYLSADPDLRIDPFGPPAGVGAGFWFEGRDGTGTQTVAEITGTTVTYAIDLGAMGRPTQRITALPEGDAARVTWTVESDMGMNPVFRVFGLFMDRMMGGTFEQGLANLGQAAA